MCCFWFSKLQQRLYLSCFQWILFWIIDTLLKPADVFGIKNSKLINNSFDYTGGPQKECNTYDQWFKKTRDRINKLCPLLRIKFFYQQDDTKIINFDEGVLILWLFFWGNVIFKICHFRLKSHNWRPKCFHSLVPLGKISALVLKNEDIMNKENHSLHNSAVLQSREGT